MGLERFAETEGTFTVADRLWRTEMQRVFGPDAVLLHGYGAERQGAPGTRLRTTFEARRSAIAAWRHVRRPAHTASSRLAKSSAQSPSPRTGSGASAQEGA